MTQKNIKVVMRNWYKAQEEGDDTSYNKLYEALYTLASAGLIDRNTWNSVMEYDEKLFREEV